MTPARFAVSLCLAAVSALAAKRGPVSGMDAHPKAATAIQTQHGGKTYTFFSPKCKKDFAAAPGKYVPKRQPAPDDSGVRVTQ